MPRKKVVASKRVPTPKNGTVLEYTLQNGKTIKAVVADGKPCCSMCERALPKQKALSAQEVARLEARQAKLIQRLLQEQEHILDMTNKTRKKLGKDPLTLDEVTAELAMG